MSFNDDQSTEQRRKIPRFTKEMAIADIASSIGHITKSIESMSENYREILRINKNVVTYLQNIEKCEKEINQTNMTDIEHTSEESNN